MLVLSLMGYTGLWEAVVADVGTALVVILNGMTVLSGVKESKEQANEVEGCVSKAVENELPARTHAHSHGGAACNHGHSDAGGAGTGGCGSSGHAYSHGGAGAMTAGPFRLKSTAGSEAEVSSCAHKKC